MRIRFQIFMQNWNWNVESVIKRVTTWAPFLYMVNKTVVFKNLSEGSTFKLNFASVNLHSSVN